MFSGIIEEVGVLMRCEPTAITIRAQKVLEGTQIKDSIAVDGICLTVIASSDGWFTVETMPETLRRTRLGKLAEGCHVNLERSLAVNGRLGGHMVQGHVEASVQVMSAAEEGIGRDMRVALPEQIRPYVIPKGFIALNGVSLTVVDVWDEGCSVSLIPYTREHTNLGEALPGTWLNVETDILGRYVAQFIQSQRIGQADLSGV